MLILFLLSSHLEIGICTNKLFGNTERVDGGELSRIDEYIGISLLTKKTS